jgi:hypothetical protein
MITWGCDTNAGRRGLVTIAGRRTMIFPWTNSASKP